MEINKLEERRYLSWSLMTYASEDAIRQLCFGSEHWAYIYHDKDNSTPHYHVLLRYRSQKKFKTILKELNSDQNTFGEQIRSFSGIVKYLTHENAPDKYQYSLQDIKSDSLEWWQSFDLPISDDDKQNPNLIINDILNGVSLRQLLSRYGKTIVFQWRAWSNMAQMIANQDQGIKLEYEHFAENADDRAERLRFQRLFDNGTFLYNSETGEIMENYQKTLDKLD